MTQDKQCKVKGDSTIPLLRMEILFCSWAQLYFHLDMKNAT